MWLAFLQVIFLLVSQGSLVSTQDWNKTSLLIPGNKTSLLSGNMTSLLSGNMTSILSGNKTSLQSGNMTSQLSGNNTSLLSGNVTSQLSGNMTSLLTPCRTPKEDMVEEILLEYFEEFYFKKNLQEILVDKLAEEGKECSTEDQETFLAYGRFYGDGYVRLDHDLYFIAGAKNSFQFKFKAEQPDGLMFLTGNVEKGAYLAVKLKDSRVVFSLKQEDADLVEIESKEKIELDTWYDVEVERDGPAGKLNVNGECVGAGVSLSYYFYLTHVTELYFGGYPDTLYENIQDDFFTGYIIPGFIRMDTFDPSSVKMRKNVGTACL